MVFYKHVCAMPLLLHSFALCFESYPTAHRDRTKTVLSASRRTFVTTTIGCSIMAVGCGQTRPAIAANFTPGGTLVDRQVGVTVQNSEASANRSADNSNVLFSQDYYFKFGVAAPWIDETNREEFPAQMPFTRTQQRYDALKKYGDRVIGGLNSVSNLKNVIDDGSYTSIPDGNNPQYALRALGLLANNLCASENTGTTNELLLARWYVNEIYLAIGDIRSARNPEAARASYRSAIKAANSVLTMLNRVITPKVGDQFALL